MRRWMFFVIPLLVAGCATWGQGGFDGGRSFDDRSDTAITTDNVTQLHEVWKLPGSTPVVGGGHVFDSLNDPSPIVRHALVAYPEAGCTGSGVPTCAESWSLDGRYSPPATDGTSVFAVNLTTNVLRVLGTDGTPRWTYTPSAVAGATTVLAPDIRIDNGTVWLDVRDTKGGARTDRLVSLPAAGCNAATCAATLTIGGNAIATERDNNGVDVGSFLATEGVVLASRATTTSCCPDVNVHAYDPTTGSELWRSSEDANLVAARDGRAYARLACETSTCTPGVIYPLHAGASCTGTPKTCTAIASLSRMTNGPVLTANHVVTVDTGGDTVWYSNTCTGGCAKLASKTFIGYPGPVGFAAQGALVFTAGIPSVGNDRISAFDDSLASCPGGTCTANWTTNPSVGVRALAVSGGRLYASETDGFVHVYGL
jgi:hypothetical protein